MKASAVELLKLLPRPATEKWPEGLPFTQALAHGTMSVELFRPIGADHQQPHEQDELYFIAAGHSEFLRDGQRLSCQAGDVLFVPARMPHRFENFSSDFITWVVFWGPAGGE